MFGMFLSQVYPALELNAPDCQLNWALMVQKLNLAKQDFRFIEAFKNLLISRERRCLLISKEGHKESKDVFLSYNTIRIDSNFSSIKIA